MHGLIITRRSFRLMHNSWNSVLVLLALVLWSTVSSGQPLFENSVVSHDIDLIASDSPTVQSEVRFKKNGRREMPDKRREQLFDDNAHVFELEYKDGTSVEVWGHSDFKNQLEVRTYVQLISEAVGKLPKGMRDTLHHVVLHRGNETAYAEHLGHFFVLYSENIRTRYNNHDLEETVFHESVHAALDYIVLDDPDWLSAQKRDGNFITWYAARNPDKEDLAESALFAFSKLQDPTSMPPGVINWLEENIPNRLRYLSKLFEQL